MQEIVEFRVPLENPVEHLPVGLGVDLRSVRKVELPLDDPLVARIGVLQRQFNAKGKSFFHGWMVQRRYSQHELDEARLLHVGPKKAFEPAGEECGTVYDDTQACEHVFSRTPERQICGYRIPSSVDTCGVGARQVTPLFLDGRRIPRIVDFARTIANEIVVSARVVHVFREHRLADERRVLPVLVHREGDELVLEIAKH